MRRVAASRREHPDLLTRETPEVTEDRWAALLIDPVAQVTELADLVARGLVSPEDFERQRGKIFGA
jgi:hypothetical protein